MSDLSGIRSIQSKHLKQLNQLWNESYPMLEDWVKVMVEKGVYNVIDSKGTRLSVEQAIELLK